MWRLWNNYIYPECISTIYVSHNNNLLNIIISISKCPLPPQLNIYTQLFSSNHKQHDKISFFSATFYHHPDHHIFLIELTSHKNPNWVAVCCAKPDTRCTYVEGKYNISQCRAIDSRVIVWSQRNLSPKKYDQVENVSKGKEKTLWLMNGDLIWWFIIRAASFLSHI